MVVCVQRSAQRPLQELHACARLNRLWAVRRWYHRIQDGGTKRSFGLSQADLVLLGYRLHLRDDTRLLRGMGLRHSHNKVHPPSQPSANITPARCHHHQRHRQAATFHDATVCIKHFQWVVNDGLGEEARDQQDVGKCLHLLKGNIGRATAVPKALRMIIQASQVWEHGNDEGGSNR